MANKNCIYSNRCWLEGKLQPATICFENGIITEIHHYKIDEAEDVGNNILMPGVIDAHVHINEPGRTEWEGFDTATQAAAAGGITTVVDMPLNASPVTTNAKAFNEKLTASKDKLHVNVGFYGGLVPGNQNDLEGLMKAGVLGIKCFLTHSGIDEFPNVGEKEIAAAMQTIAKYNLPLLAHCEIFKKAVDNEFSDFPNSYRYYLASRPKQWENDAIDLMIKLCRKHKCATHIVHVSSAEALPAIKKAKEEGLPLTAETCTHYIYFNAEDIPDSNCLYKCAPPIREKENNDLLKEALVAGILDFIATDHSPAPPDIKELETGNLQKAWGGIAGLQFLLPAGWTAMKEKISIEKFIPLLTEHPATFLKADDRKGKLAIGYDADLVVWNPDEKFEVKPGDILHRYNCSPYNGKQLSGTVQQTIVNGITVYQNKKNSTKKRRTMAFEKVKEIIKEAPAFTGLTDLAAERMGGKVLYATDDFFAEKENLIKPTRGIFIADKYTDRGKWMDGWESCRKRHPGHDWAVVQLATPGKIVGFDIDTNFFLGNHPPHASIEAINIVDVSAISDWEKVDWKEILPKSHLDAGSQNFYESNSDEIYTHVRLHIYPDGGVARLRVYGEVFKNWDLVAADEEVDLAAAINGAKAIECNDMFFSSMANLIMPGRGINMGDGWETKRNRTPENRDWVILKLARPGIIERVVVDTCHFKGNYPDTCTIEACNATNDADVINDKVQWSEILPKQKLSADKEHEFIKEINHTTAVSYVRLNIFPDGGVSRLRLFGKKKD